MGPKIGTYVGNRADETHERRIVFDLKALHTWLIVIGIAGGWLASAAVGVYSTANIVVPPIARKAMEPEIRKIELNAGRIEANAEKVNANTRQLEQDMKLGNQQTIETLRGDIAQLSRALDSYQHSAEETTRVVHELLLKLPRGTTPKSTQD